MKIGERQNKMSKETTTDQEKHDEIEKEINKLWGHIIYGIGLPNDQETQEHISYLLFHKALTLLVDMNKVNMKPVIDDPENQKKMEEIRDFISMVFDTNKKAMIMAGYR